MRATMRCLFVFLAVVALAVAEGVVDFTELPQCARDQCKILAQADANCVPPAAPVTNQGIYQSCVCESSLLAPLKTSGSLCQQAGCSADDATKIAQYYIALCNGPVKEPEATATETEATATETTATATSEPTSGAVGNNPVSTRKSSWISQHWKWIIMVIVIFIAIVFFWVGGIYLRRHMDRKRAAKLASHSAETPPHNLPAQPPREQDRNGGSGNGAASKPSMLQSMRMADGSRASVPVPVAWGPHQHHAHAYGNQQNDSPGASISPSPQSGIGLPKPVFRNRESVGSEQKRFVNYRTTPNSSKHNSTHLSPTQGQSGHVGSSAPIVNDPEKEASLDRNGMGTPPAGPIHNVNRRTLAAIRSDPTLSANFEPQSAEICEVSPQKLQKPRKL